MTRNRELYFEAFHVEIRFMGYLFRVIFQLWQQYSNDFLYLCAKFPSMSKPNITDSIWTKYQSIVEENKNRRKQKGDWNEDEADELIYDPNCENDLDEEGNRISFPWQYSNLLSARWVQDLFGVDWRAVQKLMSVNDGDLVFDDVLYYREQHVIYVLDILQTLAKSTIVNVLRPIPQVIKEIDEPIYTSKDMMRILNVKETTLSKLRANFELGYTKFGDKIVYTHKDLMDFVFNPKYRNEAV